MQQFLIPLSQNTSLGVSSEPRITGVTSGVNTFILTVQLYAGHTSSLYFNVSIINMQGVLLVSNIQPQNSISTNLMNYTITVPFNQPGQTRFMVTARNSFGDTMESAMCPPMRMDGVEGMLKPDIGVWTSVQELFFSFTIFIV